MAKAKTYTTKTDPPLVLDVIKEEDEYVVTLTGDRVKELMRSRDEAAAQTYFEEIKAHFVERATSDPQASA